MSGTNRAVRVPSAPVALSTTSVYPEPVGVAFELAAELGYDGVEVMVFTDDVSQNIEALAELSARYDMPVLAVHSPCLLVTQRVWNPDPFIRLQLSVDMARQLQAAVVVTHPPFKWQRGFGRRFEQTVAELEADSGVMLAVENIYPLRARGNEVSLYQPWDVTGLDVAHFTLDTSHTAVSRSDALAMAKAMGDRLVHLHLADGSGALRDEHLVPGRGTQPCGRLLGQLAAGGFSGTVVAEVSTRSASGRPEREADLAEALAFARLHLAAPAR